MARQKKKRGHGQGGVYCKGPGRWWISWRENGVRKSAHGFRSKDEADQRLAKITLRVRAGQVGAPEHGDNVKLSTLADAWLDRREKSGARAIKQDRSRWRKHLGPFFGNMRPVDVDEATLRRFIEARLSSGLSSTSVRHLVRLLSSLFGDLVERRLATRNPVATLPRASRALLRDAHDPKNTPYLESLDAIWAVYRAMKPPLSIAFLIGAMVGLRPGEVLGLHREDIDLERRRLTVRWQVKDGELGPPKDKDTRVTILVTAVAGELGRWLEGKPTSGLMFRPKHPKRGGRAGSPSQFVRPSTLNKHLRKALVACKFRDLTWYEATRHTFASLWVLSGGSIEKLAKLMGHSSTRVTERYAHLRPDLFREGDYDTFGADPGAIGSQVVTGENSEPGKDSDK
jgi:integrase